MGESAASTNAPVPPPTERDDFRLAEWNASSSGDRPLLSRKLVAVAACLVAFVLGVTLPAFALTAKQWDRARVNTFRANHGIASLHYKYAIQHRAQAWANHLASAGVLADDVRGQYACWRIGGHIYGSNVGDGGSVRTVEYALEKSPPHRANLLDPHYYWLGLGKAQGHGLVWLVQEFCR